MPDPASMGVVSAFGAILKGAQALKDLAVSVEVKSKVTELYDLILAGQQSALENNLKQQAMLETITQLKEELAQCKTWQAEKQRYQLHEPWQGAFVYALKESSSAGEPAHWICTKCHGDGKKYILQDNGRLTVHDHAFVCFGCGRELKSSRSSEHPKIGYV